jgi:hypothetical protein
MNKRLGLFLISIVFAFTTSAQLSNPGFELINSDSSVSYWGTTLMIIVDVDSISGNTDSLVYDESGLYGIVHDAHSGNNAIEIRNIWNYTDNIFYSGNLYSGVDSIFSSYGLLTPISYNPYSLNFFYKYAPVGNDTAFAKLNVLDSNANIIGTSISILSAGQSTYTLHTSPVTYTSNAPAAYVTVSFGPSLNQVHFGSRLKIDDVSLEHPLSIADDQHTSSMVSLYPMPCQDRLFIMGGPDKIEQAEIYNLTGNLQLKDKLHGREINVSSLAPGIYFLKLSYPDFSRTAKIIITQ